MSDQDQIKLFKALAVVAQWAGVISVILLALSVYSVLMSTRREQKLTTKKLYYSILLSALSLGVLRYFTKVSIETSQWIIFGGLGLGLGWYWSQTVQVFRKADGVYNRNTMMYVALWGITMIISQIFSNLSQKYLTAAVLSSILSFGVVVGMNLSLLKKFNSVPGPSQPAAPAAPQAPTATLIS